jgi:hypothetical protein
LIRLKKEEIQANIKKRCEQLEEVKKLYREKPSVTESMKYLQSIGVDVKP